MEQPSDLDPQLPPLTQAPTPRTASSTAHLIVSEARSGGATNLSTAYSRWGGAASPNKGFGGHRGSMMGVPKGKYNWHTVVDGLSK